MSTKRECLDKVLEKMEPLDVSARAMFGEYGLYFKGRFFGVVCDDTIFIKITERGAPLAGRIAKAPPFPGAKPWYRISAAKASDREWLTSFIEETVRDLPPPKKMKVRRIS
jgi:TfoX/Sxy family transcriptional regulator of competence genes